MSSPTPTTLTSSTLENLLSPLLASLPTASVAPSPPPALLPLLSPILRQRVQYLSSTSSSSDPWLPLLSYDSSSTTKLTQLVSSDRLEPHPVSGEVELDWETEVEVRYRRIDEETLQAVVGIRELGFGTRCVWCAGDQEGGGDGWRIGEIFLLEGNQELESAKKSIAEAEEAFKSDKSKKDGYLIINNGAEAVEEDDDDDDYWAQYDNTPARTPAPPQHSPAPAQNNAAPADEASYYAQYADVQPAMDNHDPDEEVPEGIESSLGQDEIRRELDSHPELTSTSMWETAHGEAETKLAHPRPGSSSSGEDTVARLEREAERKSESTREETGIKQHIGTSIKSLYRLARVAGIERSEFERLVRTELECLALMDEDE